MAQGTVVLAGSLPVERLALDHLVAEFGWSLKAAGSLRGVAALNADHNLVAVLFSPRGLALPWEQALRGILNAAPEALPILCQGFSDAIHWPKVVAAGGFHSLFLPFHMGEVRQSLGFVWDAKCRAASISICRDPHPRTVVREQTLAGGTSSARNVA